MKGETKVFLDDEYVVFEKRFTISELEQELLKVSFKPDDFEWETFGKKLKDLLESINSIENRFYEFLVENSEER